MPLIEKPKHERHEPVNPNELQKQITGINNKIALKSTEMFGSMGMFYLLFTWALLPLIPYLAKLQPFILYVSAGIIQLIALPLIIVGQNLQGRHSEIRAEEEFKTTTTSYHDIEHILKHLDAQDEELLKQTKMIEEVLKKIESKPKV